MRKTLLVAALFAIAGSAFAAPVTYQLDPNHTGVTVQWSHFGLSNPTAHFGQVEGTLVYDADNVAASSVQATLPLSALTGYSPKFDEHLHSAEIFDATQYPAATFKSTKVEAAGDGKLKVTGDLTVKNITKPVVLDVVLNKVGEHPMKKTPAVGFDATTTLSRTAFGVGLYAPMVSDEVKLTITAEATAPAAK